MNDEKQKENHFSQLKGYKKAVPIIFAALAVFTAACVFSKGSGFLGNGIGSLLRGLFSIGAYFIPFLLGIHAICYATDVAKRRFVSRSFFSVCLLLSASMIEYAVCHWGTDAIFAPARFYSDATAGGFIGGVLGFAFMKMIGGLGVIILAIAILAIYAIFFYADRTGEFGQKAIFIAEKVLGFLAKTEGDVKKKIADEKTKKAELEEEAHRNRSDDLLNDSFFTASGVDDLRIDELGIGEAPVEDPVIEEPAPVRKKRDPQKPIDLDYKMEITTEVPAEEKTEGTPETSFKSEDAGKAFDNFGIEDDPEKVFTKNFDPFDFATGEKIASKPSSKATFEEELDEMTMLELKGEPSDKEKRMMELEQRKKIWLERNKARSISTAEPSAPPIAPTPSPAPAVEPISTPTPAQSAPSVPTPASYEAPTAATAPQSAEAPKEINAYTSYSSTQTTYTQPVKTVEFTINGDKTPPSPKEGTELTRSYAKNEPSSESAEDVAAFIAAKIARANPGYARSANEMVTYMKITPSPSEFVAEGGEAAEVSFADRIIEEARLASDSSETLFGESTSIRENNSQQSENSEGNAIFSDIEFEEEPADIDETDSFFPTLSEESITENNTSDPMESEADAILGLTSHSQGEAVNYSKSSYERAAGFVAAMEFTEAASEQKTEPAPEFKPYDPLASTPASEPVAAHKEETIKVERSMLTPTAQVITEAVSSPETISFAPDAKDQPEVYSFEGEESEPLYTELEENASSTNNSDIPQNLANGEIDWEAEDEAPEITESSTQESTISFTEADEDNAEDDEAEDELEASNVALDEIPEEDDAPIEEIPPEEQNPDVIKMREMFPFLTPIEEQKSAPAKKAEPEITKEPEAPIVEESDDDMPPFDGAIIKESPKSEPVALVSMEEIEKEEKKSKKPDYSNYEFPPIELLAKEEAFTDENIQAEIQENADKLIETLASFGVTASIKGVDRGPRITRYEVVPAKGVKVSSILNLQDDIALNLAAGSIRMEAPIPGKSAVGIEIPNKKSSTVRLRDLLETEDFVSNKSKTAICIGRDVAGQPVFGDIAKMPHLLIAGATGMGKSVCINSLMISILYKARPDEVKFIMIDPKQVEFTMYNGIPHLLVPVVSDAKQAAGALMWAVEEMERRYNLLNPLCVRNVEAYNEKVTADPSLGEPMSKIVIVIDEFADLMLQVKDPVETLVMRIAQKARAAGIHLIIGTQRPSVNVITGVIKANVPSRISCKVMSNVDSKTVLDSAGAEKLLDRGDMLYAPAGSPKPHRVQGAFVADGEVEAIMAHLKKFSDGSNYDSSVMEEIERAAQKCSKKGGGGASDNDDGDDEVHGEGYLNDRQFLDAVEVAVNTRKISTSLIQRKLSIGYGKAAKFIDIMEDMGIVGEANGQRPREVLISPDEWREKLARASLD